MKIIISTIITSSLLLSSSLEDTLLKTDFKNMETEKIDYLTVQVKKEQTTYKTNVKANSYTAYNKGLSKIKEIDNKAIQELNDRYREYKSNYNIKYTKNKNEIIVIKNLEIPELYKKFGIKEKIIISFIIDENKNISNINFEKEPKYNEIKEKFIEAIIKSRYELITNNKKERITLYYDFII